MAMARSACSIDNTKGICDERMNGVKVNIERQLLFFHTQTHHLQQQQHTNSSTIIIIHSNRIEEEEEEEKACAKICYEIKVMNGKWKRKMKMMVIKRGRLPSNFSVAFSRFSRISSRETITKTTIIIIIFATTSTYM